MQIALNVIHEIRISESGRKYAVFASFLASHGTREMDVNFFFGECGY